VASLYFKSSRPGKRHDAHRDIKYHARAGHVTKYFIVLEKSNMHMYTNIRFRFLRGGKGSRAEMPKLRTAFETWLTPISHSYLAA
jgi:hypothetical protein